MAIQQYQSGNWDTSQEIMNFAAVASVMLFLLVGVFATWFFSIVHGISSSPPEGFKAAEE